MSPWALVVFSYLQNGIPTGESTNKLAPRDWIPSKSLNPMTDSHGRYIVHLHTFTYVYKLISMASVGNIIDGSCASGYRLVAYSRSHPNIIKYQVPVEHSKHSNGSPQHQKENMFLKDPSCIASC